MRVLLLDPDPAFLEERRRLRLDRRDEVWDGVYHVVPSANTEHQRGMYRLVEPRADGTIHGPRFDLTLRVVEGPKLRVEWSGGSAEI
jgi:hypothetical protein